jgi:hypothetical protein
VDSGAMRSEGCSRHLYIGQGAGRRAVLGRQSGADECFITAFKFSVSRREGVGRVHWFAGEDEAVP